MNIVEVWEKAKDKIKVQLGETAFETWIASTKVKSTENNAFILEVPDKFFRDWLLTHYMEIIQDCLKICGYAGDVEIKINPYILKSGKKRKLDQFEFQFQDSLQDSLKLNPRFTFENFIVGPSNKFAHAVSLSVGEAPGKRYNPLFIYGEVGLGKTHLLQAVAHRIKEDNPDAIILYLSAESFVNQLIKSIQNQSTEKFRQKFRNVDILLIDDIHFWGGKPAAQEEFFHTFNILYDNHKQIILSSDRPPKEIPRMEERLVSRFVWGMVADIQAPEFETRMAILRKKIENETTEVPAEVLEFIAEKITSNIRELEGALIRVLAYSLIEEKAVTLELAQEVLKDMVKESRKNITVPKILEVTGRYFSVSTEDIKSSRRTKSFLIPRQVAMFLARKLTDLSLKEISKYFGNRDHATILHSVQKIESELKKDEKIKNLVTDIEQEIKRD